MSLSLIVQPRGIQMSVIVQPRDIRCQQCANQGHTHDTDVSDVQPRGIQMSVMCNPGT